MRDVLLLITGACLLSAATFRPPRLGYVYDSADGAIRVISGVSGAAALEETVPVASKLAFAAIAPGARFAIVRMRDEAGLGVLQLDSGAIKPLEGAAGTGDLLAFSPGAASAALWTGERIQVWTGLPDAPVLVREIASGDVTALAVADDGEAAAAITREGTLLWEAAETARALPAATALSFAAGSHDLLIADEGGDRITAIRGTEAEALATTAHGIAGAVALAVGSDGRTLAVANSGGGSIALVNLSSGAVAVVGCECTPRELLPLAGDRLFAVQGANGSVTLLDAARGEPALFVLSAGGKR